MHLAWEIPQMTMADDRQWNIILQMVVGGECLRKYCNISTSHGMDVVASEKCQKQG